MGGLGYGVYGIVFGAAVVGFLAEQVLKWPFRYALLLAVAVAVMAFAVGSVVVAAIVAL